MAIDELERDQPGQATAVPVGYLEKFEGPVRGRMRVSTNAMEGDLRGPLSIP
jgi:hypothetical protein